MPRYIPFDKMQKLREAAKNGDERAKKILRAQLEDKEDFSCDLEDYFKPVEELVNENVSETVDETTVEEAAQENVQEGVQEGVQENVQKQPQLITGQAAPQSEISQKILDLIGACDKQTLEIANDTELSDATKKGALSILGEIKQSCLENLEKFGKLMSSISKKTESQEEEQLQQ